MGILDSFLGFHLRLAQEASFRMFARKVDELQVRPQRYAILTIIGNNPGVTQKQLSIASGRDKSTLTAALSDLHRNEFIDRRSVPTDLRSSTLHLTEKGQMLLEDLTRHARDHEAELDAIMGPDKVQMIAWLRKLTAALSAADVKSDDDD
ncbi:MarR family transcriptional regulator [Agrobacterium sp. a22-2]|nr:MarR family transcriptional regulator [Agrobacterium sp. a22-2]